MNIDWTKLLEVFFMLFDSIVSNFGGVTIIVLMLTLARMLYISHQGKQIDWADLIRTKGSNNLSLTKFLQLVGGLTGTWMVVYMTLHNKLSYDILLVYLTYVGAIEGWSKYVSAKFSTNSTPTPPQEDTTTTQ